MDFRSPFIKQIADFLLFLFQEKHLQPSTIGDYKTAVTDTIGNEKVNISKGGNLTCLLDSFPHYKPNGGCPLLESFLGFTSIDQTYFSAS